jgi:hypothetical protein
MKVHRPARIRRKWSDAERLTATHLVKVGATNAEIAVALGRKPDAVRAWIHHNCRVWREPKPTSYPKIRVASAEVPEWYSLGWRFVGFEQALCVFEWQSSQRVRWPVEGVRRVA